MAFTLLVTLSAKQPKLLLRDFQIGGTTFQQRELEMSAPLPAGGALVRSKSTSQIPKKRKARYWGKIPLQVIDRSDCLNTHTTSKFGWPPTRTGTFAR